MFPLAEAEVKEDLKGLRDEMLHLRPTCSHRNETSGPWAAAVCRGWPSLGRAQAPAISSRVSPGAAQSPWPARRLAAAWRNVLLERLLQACELLTALLVILGGRLPYLPRGLSDLSAHLLGRGVSLGAAFLGGERCPHSLGFFAPP